MSLLLDLCWTSVQSYLKKVFILKTLPTWNQSPITFLCIVQISLKWIYAHGDIVLSNMWFLLGVAGKGEVTKIKREGRMEDKGKVRFKKGPSPLLWERTFKSFLKKGEKVVVVRFWPERTQLKKMGKLQPYFEIIDLLYPFLKTVKNLGVFFFF